MMNKSLVIALKTKKSSQNMRPQSGVLNRSASSKIQSTNDLVSPSSKLSRTGSNFYGSTETEARGEKEVKLEQIKEEIATVEVEAHKTKGNGHFGWSSEDHDALMKQIGISRFKTQIENI